MTDEKPQSPAPLTDKQRATQQVGITDMTTGAAQALSGMFPFGGRVRFFGKTDFEGHRLNEMIDLIHPANPQHLISAGDALFAAHEAISSAAAELRGHIGKVEWEGESGEAFRTWGNNLANHANRLAEFADTAGVQISAAGQGLVSVKSAMPPRDHRAEPVKVDDLPSAKRVAGNAEYEAALKVEQDRQEAINQMNRLSSFYSVSEQTLAAQEPPVFEPMPKVGVPRPTYLPRDGEPERHGPVSPSRHSPDGRPEARYVHDSPGSQGRLEVSGRPTGTTGHTTLPATLPPVGPVGTEVDSVAPLPDTASVRAVATPPAPVVPVAPGGMTVLPPGGGYFSPTVNGSARAFAGGRGPSAGPVKEPAGGTGRGIASPVGGVEAPRSEAVRGGVSAAGPQLPMGRGVSGGTPRPGGATSPREGSAATSGSGRNGIVGGRPNVGAQGSAGAQRSRTAVVGSKPTTGTSVPAGRPGRKSVIGAVEPSGTGGARTGGRAKGNVDGVVGVPKGRSSGSRESRSGFTSGGSGLVRVPREERATDDEDDETALFHGRSSGDGEMGKNA
ncbi:hypothetical protein ACIOUE_27150 [Streptomyces xanthochromogenes]|uniref:hypothetical protein n=1 Tax=Streptomyces xanthochromogenes TaxID=67384 RepID=UPI003810458F